MITIGSQSHRTKLLIIGDIVVDETWYSETKKLSPEAPVPVATLIKNQPDVTIGGAGLAARYAIKNCVDVNFITACSRENKSRLEWLGIPTVSIEPIVNVIKKRYIDINSGYHLIRVDNDEVVDKPNIVTENIYPEMERIIDEEGISIVSLLDYRKGMFFNHITCKDMISLCRKKRIPVYVDTRCSPIKFRGANYLKLNDLEYAAAKKELNIDDPYEMIRRLEISSLIVTRGKDGATLYGSQTGSETNIHPREYNGTPDVTGCGDVFGVNFCDYISTGREKYKSKYNMEIDAVKEAVDRASFFAYQNIGDRL